MMDLEDEESSKLLKIIEADSLFLSQHNLMDYSLLLVVETNVDDLEISESNFPRMLRSYSSEK